MPSKSSVVGVIPARLSSTRLPAKMLQDIHGHPLIYYTYQAARQSRLLDRVIIACDHKRIAQAATLFGAEATMTSPSHPSGTSRIAEVAADLSASIIVNIQGDEPLMHPDTIDAVAKTLLDAPASVEMATAAVTSTDDEAYHNPNVVKVVTGADGTALYFSRAPIPHYRQASQAISFKKHLGIYAYRPSLLARYRDLPPAQLAELEKLEQLVPLADGAKIAVVNVPHDSIGIDTPTDLQQVRDKLRAPAATVHHS